jgi:hypothetical protein
LETLVEKGFAKKYTKNNANYYSPVKPDDLKSLLERRRKKIIISYLISQISLRNFVILFPNLFLNPRFCTSKEWKAFAK